MSNRSVIRGIGNQYFTMSCWWHGCPHTSANSYLFCGLISASTTHRLILSQLTPFGVTLPLAPIRCRVHWDSCKSEEGLANLLWELDRYGVVYLAMAVILQVIQSKWGRQILLTGPTLGDVFPNSRLVHHLLPLTSKSPLILLLLQEMKFHKLWTRCFSPPLAPYNVCLTTKRNKHCHVPCK